MATLTTAPASKVQDSDLAAWLSEDSGELREVLIDAAVPSRQVTLAPRPDGRLLPVDLRSEASPRTRDQVLRRLKTFLTRLLDTPPVVLEAAGALAVRASSHQMRQVVEHPLVKSVRPNRKLRQPT